ncbi:5,6-dimethylbenzimidazole synthase [Aeromicrobium halocynthiae]|uniref:5,6-dimethylbenzimidazole synthase n=1 Tax=Aeromicrobium halocynthiae TaxID=560557 RepID=A0ABN2VPR1_9ACTN
MTQEFDHAEREAVYRVIAERRDMRHFAGGSVDELVLRRLLEAAHAAPSVGLMQPWRFLRIVDATVREQIGALVADERDRTAAVMGERAAEFLRLKVEGIADCAELLVVALGEGRDGHVFGRRTMPHMDLASVACAIENLWLAARAENLGMGWVSMFDPVALGDLLDLPEGSEPVAVLCLGPVDRFYDRPMLVEERWARARPLDELLEQR